jgi:hypothetical protein
MGFNNFCSYLYSNQIKGDNISSLGGKTLGVDISGWLHKVIKVVADTYRFARSFFQIPPISLEDFINIWLSAAFRIFDLHKI